MKNEKENCRMEAGSQAQKEAVYEKSEENQV